jgi:hypothetical protein
MLTTKQFQRYSGRQDRKISFLMSDTMYQDLQDAAEFHDLLVSQIIRKSLSEWLLLYMPKEGSVIEPDSIGVSK